MNWIEVRAVQWPDVSKRTGLLHYCTFALEAADDKHDVRRDTARGKDNDQQKGWYNFRNGTEQRNAL